MRLDAHLNENSAKMRLCVWQAHVVLDRPDSVFVEFDWVDEAEVAVVASEDVELIEAELVLSNNAGCESSNLLHAHRIRPGRSKELSIYLLIAQLIEIKPKKNNKNFSGTKALPFLVFEIIIFINDNH